MSASVRRNWRTAVSSARRPVGSGHARSCCAIRSARWRVRLSEAVGGRVGRVQPDGDPPDRQEPGTGETNYANVFKTLREEGFADFVGLEHGTSSTPEHAIRVVKGLAGV